MLPSIHILMTGAGAPGAPGIIHCLRQDPRIRLTVADADPNATGRWLHEDFVLLPRGDDPHFPETLLGICLEKRIGLVLPLVTKELHPLSLQRERFASKGVHLLVSPESAIAIANDKGACYRFLQQQGIPVPGFFTVKTLEAFTRAAADLGYPHRPFCFKPCTGNGSRGVRIVSEALDESDLLFNRKPYQLHMSYGHALEVLASKPFPELLLSEYLPGEEYSVDCIARDGALRLAVPRSRQKMVNGISVQGTFIHDEAIIAYCKAIIAASGLHGNIGIQLKRTEDGTPLLLEINPRVQGTIVAAMGAGVNLPLLAVKGALDWPVDPDEMTPRWGTRFSRYWTEVFY